MAPHEPETNGTPHAHILVADDEQEVRDFLQEVLALAGHRVTLVADGLGALEAARRDAPQVVLTDLNMSPMPGRDLILALKEECPSAVAVVLTGHGTVHRAVDLMRLGAFDVLTKPCRAEHIAATVQKALEHHGALRSNAELRERLRVQDKLAMIGKLAAGVAHELNNPLDAALRCIRLTRAQLNGDTEAHEYLDLAETGLKRMADIVQSLLNFSRNAVAEQTPQALEELVSDAITAVTLAMGDAAPPIGREIRPAVARQPVPRGLHQVLVNLLKNACDASPSARPIVVRALRDGDEVVIEVEDHGSGIPESIRGRVFEPFFTTKAPGRGTGLGLPLSARLVEKFGGRIELVGDTPQGTTVRVTLPLTPPPPGTAESR